MRSICMFRVVGLYAYYNYVYIRLLLNERLAYLPSNSRQLMY